MTMTRDEAIHIVAASDNAYAQHLAVMLLSVFENCRSRPVQAHVLVAPGFSEQMRVRTSLGPWADQVHFASISEETIRSLKIPDYLSLAAYYRLFLGEVLPASARRAIYLDCDLIVRADLALMLETDLGGCVIAAVPDAGSQAGETRHVLALPPNALYFNSGVLLIDLVLWRDQDIARQVLSFATENPDRLTWGDQCALNWVLRDRWKPLGMTWNVQTPSFGCDVAGELRYFQPVPPAAMAGRIIHFTAPGRPWLYMSEHPRKQDYLQYLARTEWRGQRPADLYPHNRIRKALRHHMPALLPAYMALRRYV